MLVAGVAALAVVATVAPDGMKRNSIKNSP